MSFRRDRLPTPVDYFDSQGVQLKGPGKWKTSGCGFHGGSDSFRVNTETGAWVCMACGEKGGDVLAFHMARTGDEFVEAAKALGCWDDDVRPSAVKPLPFSARSGLEVLRFESLLCAVAACNLAKGLALSDVDRSRLVEAAGRIEFIASEVAR